tara:strand:- start:23 stop:496 length:474 start_codon:yes stop_codon:yes gene_type:complete
MEVVGYENYLIYGDGKIQNKKTKRYLKPSDNGRGYLKVNLCKDGKFKTHKIHRLLAEHFIENPDNKRCVDHINRNRNDNRLENLRWATYSENGQNKIQQIDNKLGIKNICYNKIKNIYQYEKALRGLKHCKRFKTLEEAIEYKKKFESNTTLNQNAS